MLKKLLDIMFQTNKIYPFPYAVKAFYFEGEQPNYFAMKAGGNLIGIMQRSENIDGKWKIHFYDNELNLPFNLCTFMAFEFITDKTGVLYIEEGINSNETEVNITIQYGEKTNELQFKNGMLVLKRLFPKYHLSIDEYIAYKLYNMSKNDKYELVELMYLLVTKNITHKLHSNELRIAYSEMSTDILYLMLKNVYDKVYYSIYDRLNFSVKQNICCLGYTLENDKIVLYSI